MIVFRTDASKETGFGRLIRSACLASLLKSRVEILFCLDAASDKAAFRYLQEKNFPCCTLKGLLRRGSLPVNAVIFDLDKFTGEDIRWIERLNTGDKKTETIQMASLVNPEANREDIGDNKELPGGPGYAVLHTKFRHFNKVKRKYRKKIKKVFVCLGGATSYNRMRKAVDLLSRLQLDIKIAPGFYLKSSNLKTLRRIYPGIRFVGKTESLARSFFEADAALITPGNAAYEAAAVGTPALYCPDSEKQKPIAETFEKQGAGLTLSSIDRLVFETLAEKINALTLEKRIHMGNAGKRLVDGKGIYRVIEFLQKEKIL